MQVKAVFKSNKSNIKTRRLSVPGSPNRKRQNIGMLPMMIRFGQRFWKKIKTTFGGKVKPTKKLKSVLWSPFRGDKLYPFFNDEGKMIAFSREYKKKLMDDRRSSAL